MNASNQYKVIAPGSHVDGFSSHSIEECVTSGFATMHMVGNGYVGPNFEVVDLNGKPVLSYSEGVRTWAQ